MMSKPIFALAAGLLLVGGVASAQPAYVEAALGDPLRPATDVARDPQRKPGEVVVFSKVKPGDTVVELIPGGGYFTRIFSKVAGPNGHVIAVSIGKPGEPYTGPKDIAGNPAYANVSSATLDAAGLASLPKADVMFTAQNYHDFHLARLHVDVPGTDRAMFAALKPGGVLIVEDHVAATGAPIETADALHRIDPAIARRELEAAGFVFDGESAVLRNSLDDHSKIVFDPAIRGHTDQFLYRFKKPA
jgi:predicted methyltransferase